MTTKPSKEDAKPEKLELDTNELFKRAMSDGIREGIKSKFTGYNSPFDKLIEDSLAKFSPEIKTLLEESISSCVHDKVFREDIAIAVRSKLAGLLVQRFGGEIERQVNALKSDPTTRARITLAIEEIVKEKLPSAS